MKVREVEYSRLFNLENYNERISLRVAIDDNEDADAVIGQLFFKVLQIEEALDLYRDYLERIADTQREIERYEGEIEEDTRYLADLENRRKRLLEEEDSKVKMCQILDIDEMIGKTKERIEKLKKNRDSALSRLKALKIYKERMAELIRAGEFEKVLSSDFFEEADA